MKKILNILLISSLSFIFLSQNGFSSDEKLKIGLLVPMTGENKNLGKLIIKATRMALEEINAGNWDKACLAMLDYYDKCYEHELKKIELKTDCNVSGLNDISSAKKLLELGHVF